MILNKIVVPILIALAMVVTIIFVGVTPINAQPSELWVDGDYCDGCPNDGHTWGYDAFDKIQDGIDAVASPGTVQVAEGTYYENITLKDKVQILGAGSDVATIDGGGNSSVVTALNVLPGTVLDGFTVTNGTGTSIGVGSTAGGGIYIDGGSPTISNNVIAGNNVTSAGGGIYAISSSPTIDQNIITNNNGGHNGGGIRTHNSSLILTGNTIINNAAWQGGAIEFDAESSMFTVDANTIRDNQANGDFGGGILLWGGSGVVTNNIISGNESYTVGGGIFVTSLSLPSNITNNIITGNTADDGGGGIYAQAWDSGMVTLTNNTISNNFSNNYGGGLHAFAWHSDSIVTIINNTITGNITNSDGGGIHARAWDFGMVTLTNDIIWGNTAPTGQDIYIDEPTSQTIINYCDFADIYPEAGWGDGIGNISANPMFVDPRNGDYHLQAGSSCIDAGINEGAPDSDFEGDHRPYDVPDVDNNGDLPEFDIGADEYVPSALHMECFEVNLMNVIDMKRYGAKRDTIYVKGSLNLAEGADPFDPYTDDVTVDITFDEDVITVAIPAGSFNEKNNFGFHHYCFKGKINGVSRVDMHLNFDECRWWIKTRRMDASGLVDSDEATVKLTIGMNEGTDIIENWTKKKERRRVRFVKFIEWPPIRCCRICP